MQIIEESVVLGGETFTKTEMNEIASLCDLAKDGINYCLKTGNLTYRDRFPVKEYPISFIIRRSNALQKAFKAGLFVAADVTAPIVSSPELKIAIDIYKI